MLSRPRIVEASPTSSASQSLPSERAASLRTASSSAPSLSILISTGMTACLLSGTALITRPDAASIAATRTRLFTPFTAARSLSSTSTTLCLVTSSAWRRPRRPTAVTLARVRPFLAASMSPLTSGPIATAKAAAWQKMAAKAASGSVLENMSGSFRRYALLTHGRPAVKGKSPSRALLSPLRGPPGAPATAP